MMAQPICHHPEAVGTQAFIKRLCPKAIYTHCCGHNLALVVVTACKIPVIRNVLTIMKDASSMFVKGSKKMTLLKEVVVNLNHHYPHGKNVVFDICVTRWVENMEGYELMIFALPYIIETFEVIALGLHLGKYPTWKQWDPDSRARANHLLSSMGSFDFVIVLTLIVKILDFLKGSTKKIQGRSLDLYDVVGVVRSARADLMFERNDENYVFLRAASHTQQI